MPSLATSDTPATTATTASTTAITTSASPPPPPPPPLPLGRFRRRRRGPTAAAASWPPPRAPPPPSGRRPAATRASHCRWIAAHAAAVRATLLPRAIGRRARDGQGAAPSRRCRCRRARRRHHSHSLSTIGPSSLAGPNPRFTGAAGPARGGIFRRRRRRRAVRQSRPSGDHPATERGERDARASPAASAPGAGARRRESDTRSTDSPS